MDEIVAAIVMVVVAGLLYLLPAVPGCLPIWYFGRKRAQFTWWELGVLIVPFVIWLCFFLVSKDKSLGNLVEAPILGGAILIAAIIRVLIGRHLSRTLVAVSLITGQCILAVLLGIMFPKVPFQWFH